MILPYFPTGTMERVDQEGQVATAKTLASMLSLTPPTARGPSQLMIFDIHALQERFYFSSGIIPRLETAIPLLLQKLDSAVVNGRRLLENLAIAFPDEGAFKRYNAQFPSNFERIICTKTRSGDQRVVRIQEGQCGSKHVVIVDDLVQTGGTLLECAKILRNNDAASVSAFVTHAVFPQDSWRKFIAHSDEAEQTAENGPLLDRFWVTDSLPHARQICAHRPFELVSLAPQIADSLMGFDLRQLDY